jgi:hypothetical protein
MKNGVHFTRLQELGDATIVAGEYYRGADLGDGKPIADSAPFVARLDADGNVVWRHDLRGRADILDVYVAPDGSSYLVGQANGEMQYGPGVVEPRHSDTLDAFVAALGPDGTLLWRHQYGIDQKFSDFKTIRASGNGLEVVGNMPAGLDLGNGPVATDQADHRVRVDYDLQGHFHGATVLAEDPYTPAAIERVNGRALSFAVGGEMPTVARLDYTAADGSTWTKQIDDSGEGQFGDAMLLDTGEVVLVGSFQYDLTLDDHYLTADHNAGFLAGLAPDGHVAWTVDLPIKGRERIYLGALARTRSGGLLVGGSFDGELGGDHPVKAVSGLPALNHETDAGLLIAVSADGKVDAIHALPAPIRNLVVGKHVYLAYGYSAGPDEVCLMHDPVWTN